MEKGINNFIIIATSTIILQGSKMYPSKTIQTHY